MKHRTIEAEISMRREADELGQELPLLYMARKLNDAKKLEQVLTDNQIDYAVETGTYTGGFLFARELTGAFFYVAESDLEAARRLLTAHGWTPYERT